MSIIDKFVKVGILGFIVSILILPTQAEGNKTARNLAATCAQCHGTNGKPANDSIGVLAGMDKAELIQLVNDFRDDIQPSPIMGQIAKGYTKEQIEMIAEYFSEIK